jgi:23S rRNA (cytidine2498-2'-O)-methyltransferase
MKLCTCQPGYERTLVRELSAGGARIASQGPGWVLADGVPAAGSTYSHLVFDSPAEVKGESVNLLAHAILDFFVASLRDERITGSWPCVWGGALLPEGLGQRVATVEGAFHELLQKKLGRVGKLASPGLPRGVGPARGLFVWFTDFGRAFVAREAQRNGQRRMADDPLAPSRSYLKVEEAYGILGCEPRAGETVCDLGAAPGGWSYSAAKRGALVVAVDNGPLKAGALDHPRIEHRRADAFHFQPAGSQVFDWLFCDMVEEPHHVLRSIVEPWLGRGWCRRFVINFKLGRVDPPVLLAELTASGSPLASYATGLRLTHLYHDRDEVTATGSGRPRARPGTIPPGQAAAPSGESSRAPSAPGG